MALTKAQVREILSAAGVDSEHMGDAVEKIIDGHIASVNALREEIDRYKADAGKLAEVQKELDAAQAELSESKKDKWEVKYKAIKEDFEGFKAEQAKKESHMAKEAAYRALLPYPRRQQQASKTVEEGQCDAGTCLEGNKELVHRTGRSSPWDLYDPRRRHRTALSPGRPIFSYSGQCVQRWTAPVRPGYGVPDG